MEWQPIETAPKDQKTMFVVQAFNVQLGQKGYPYDSDPVTTWSCGGQFPRWRHNFPPTHWMPLPDAPDAR